MMCVCDCKQKHVVGCRDTGRTDKKLEAKPGRRAHVDYTLNSGPHRLTELLPASEAEALQKHPYAIIQVCPLVYEAGIDHMRTKPQCSGAAAYPYFRQQCVVLFIRSQGHLVSIFGCHTHGCSDDLLHMQG